LLYGGEQTTLHTVSLGEGWKVQIETSPHLRIQSIQYQQQDIPLLSRPGERFSGWKAWYMEPNHRKESPRPARQPMQSLENIPQGIVAAAQRDPDSGLQLHLRIQVDPASPHQLVIYHGFKNHLPQNREIAVWSLLALPAEGTVLLPFPTEPATSTPAASWPGLQFWPGGTIPPPGMQLDSQGVSLDLTIEPESWYKLGTRSSTGRIIWHGTEHPSFSVTSPRIPEVLYPEGGCDLTLYRRDGIAELENVGPLTTITPGETLWLSLTLELHEKEGLPMTPDF
jgi:hypothetical protein